MFQSFITIKNTFNKLFRKEAELEPEPIVSKLPDSYCMIFKLHSENIEQTRLCALKCPHNSECEFYLNCILKG